MQHAQLEKSAHCIITDCLLDAGFESPSRHKQEPSRNSHSTLSHWESQKASELLAACLLQHKYEEPAHGPVKGSSGARTCSFGSTARLSPPACASKAAPSALLCLAGTMPTRLTLLPAACPPPSPAWLLPRAPSLSTDLRMRLTPVAAPPSASLPPKEGPMPFSCAGKAASAPDELLPAVWVAPSATCGLGTRGRPEPALACRVRRNSTRKHAQVTHNN